MPFRIIAHRGASAVAPENTLAAFEAARELGIQEVELDVQLSRDDVVVLFHDDDLTEKTGASGRVRDYDAEALTQLDIGSWFDRSHPGLKRVFRGTPLTRLREVFERFGDDFVYHIEIKAAETALPAQLLAEIEAADLRERVIVTSFSFEQAERTRALDPEIPVCLLVRGTRELRRSALGTSWEQLDDGDLQRRWIDRAADAAFQRVGFPAEDLTKPLVRYAHDRRLEIRAWRIRGDDDVEHVIRTGANGMTTNWPDRLRDRIERGRSKAGR